MVGLEETYLGVFSGSSQNVHGAWGDLYAHHLEVGESGRFTPLLEWQWPRPQLLYSIAFISLDTASEFARFIGGDELAAELGGHLDELKQRLQIADRAHEAYLVKDMQW